MGNIHVKLFEIWTSSSEDVIQRKRLRTDDGRTKTDHNSSPELRKWDRHFHQHIKLNPLRSRNPKQVPCKIEDLNEMSHNTAFNQGL